MGEEVHSIDDEVECQESFNLTECDKLQCVKTCVENGVGWINGACLDAQQCCCTFG